MTKLLQKLGVGLATAALLSASAATTVLADATIEGNGAGSHNYITVSSKCKSTVYQSNNTSVATIANVSASTGDNQANSNTGGDVTVDTGNATAGLSVTVEGGSNEATPPDCCACVPGGDQTIAENGDGTHNSIRESSRQRTTVSQKNKTHVFTLASVKSKTGKNKANRNTDGNVEVTTGTAEAGLEVVVTAPSNTTP